MKDELNMEGLRAALEAGWREFVGNDGVKSWRASMDVSIEKAIRAYLAALPSNPAEPSTPVAETVRGSDDAWKADPHWYDMYCIEREKTAELEAEVAKLTKERDEALRNGELSLLEEWRDGGPTIRMEDGSTQIGEWGKKDFAHVISRVFKAMRGENS